MIQITPEALAAISQLCTDDPFGRSFRIYSEHKGCDGFSFAYGMDNPIEQDSCLIEGDACVLVSTRLARLIRGGVLELADKPIVQEAGSGCSVPVAQRMRPEIFQRFVLTVPDSERFRGKFYKKADGRELSWDSL